MVIFRVGFPRESLMGENFSGGNSPGGIFIEPSSYIMYLFLFFKKLSANIIWLSIKRCIL